MILLYFDYFNCVVSSFSPEQIKEIIISLMFSHFYDILCLFGQAFEPCMTFQVVLLLVHPRYVAHASYNILSLNYWAGDMELGSQRLSKFSSSL